MSTHSCPQNPCPICNSKAIDERDQLRADLATTGEQLESVCKQRDALMGKLNAAEHDLAAAQALLNTPEIIYFAKAVQLEAAHQRSRWGSDHDAGKTDADWFWLIGYLGGKALRTDDGAEKQLHRIITVAAAACNWHAAKLGQTNMRPGIDTPKGEEAPSTTPPFPGMQGEVPKTKHCAHPGCGREYGEQHAAFEKGMWADGHTFVEPAAPEPAPARCAAPDAGANCDIEQEGNVACAPGRCALREPSAPSPALIALQGKAQPAASSPAATPTCGHLIGSLNAPCTKPRNHGGDCEHDARKVPASAHGTGRAGMADIEDVSDMVENGRREGAERERRRIRRAQAGVLDELRNRRDIDVDYFDAQLAELDAATKAPRRGRR